MTQTPIPFLFLRGGSSRGPYFRRADLPEDRDALSRVLIEVIGVVIGGFLGAMSAGRFQVKVEKGPNISTRGRLRYALGGGIVMGFAAALARGCTSGQALSGGAMLATGSWAFMMMVFAGGYAFAYLVRRQWI